MKKHFVRKSVRTRVTNWRRGDSLRVLVTGGAGFVGSHLVELLLQTGHSVTVLDNLSTGLLTNVPDGVRFVKSDVCAPLDEVFSMIRPEVVVHLAAQVSVPRSLDDPVLDLSVNVGGTLNVLKAAGRFESRKIIFFSSAAVYGNRTELPLTEDTSVEGISPYGLSKLTAEKYIALLCNRFGLTYTVFRPANIYGPRQNSTADGAVIPSFLNGFLSGKDPVIHGQGTQIRDFVHVRDVAQAVSKALLLADGAVLNLSSGVGTSILELWHLIADQIGWKRPPVFGASRSGDISHSVLSNVKAQAALAWRPVVTLAEGLEDTIAWAQWQRTSWVHGD